MVENEAPRSEIGTLGATSRATRTLPPERMVLTAGLVGASIGFYRFCRFCIYATATILIFPVGGVRRSVERSPAGASRNPLTPPPPTSCPWVGMVAALAWWCGAPRGVRSTPCPGLFRSRRRTPTGRSPPSGQRSGGPKDQPLRVAALRAPLAACARPLAPAEATAGPGTPGDALGPGQTGVCAGSGRALLPGILLPEPGSVPGVRALATGAGVSGRSRFQRHCRGPPPLILLPVPGSAVRSAPRPAPGVEPPPCSHSRHRK